MASYVGLHDAIGSATTACLVSGVTGLNQGQVLIAAVFSSAGGQTASTGWTRVFNSTSGTLYTEVALYVKTAGAGESSTQEPCTQTSGSYVAIIWVFQQVGGFNVGGFTESTAAAPPAATVTATPTPSTPNGYVIVMAAALTEAASGTSPTISGGVTVDTFGSASPAFFCGHLVSGPPGALSYTMTESSGTSSAKMDAVIGVFYPIVDVAPVPDVVRASTKLQRYDANNWWFARGPSIAETPPKPPTIGRFTGVDPAPRPPYSAEKWYWARGLSVAEAPPAAPIRGLGMGVDPAPAPLYHAEWQSPRGPSISEAPPKAPIFGLATNEDPQPPPIYDPNAWLAVLPPLGPSMLPRTPPPPMLDQRQQLPQIDRWFAIRGPSIGEAPPPAPTQAWVTPDVPRQIPYNVTAWVAPWIYVQPPAPFVPTQGWFTADIRRQPPSIDRWYFARGLSVGEAPPAAPVQAWVTPDVPRATPYTPNAWVASWTYRAPPAPNVPIIGWSTPDIQHQPRYSAEKWLFVRGPSVGEAPPKAPIEGRSTPVDPAPPPRYNAAAWFSAPPPLANSLLPRYPPPPSLDARGQPRLIDRWYYARGLSVGEAPPKAPIEGRFSGPDPAPAPRYRADWQGPIVYVKPTTLHFVAPMLDARQAPILIDGWYYTASPYVRDASTIIYRVGAQMQRTYGFVGGMQRDYNVDAEVEPSDEQVPIDYGYPAGMQRSYTVDTDMQRTYEVDAEMEPPE